MSAALPRSSSSACAFNPVNASNKLSKKVITFPAAGGETLPVLSSIQQLQFSLSQLLKLSSGKRPDCPPRILAEARARSTLIRQPTGSNRPASRVRGIER
jgi:hypothetical protein